MKTKALISFVATAKLISVFVFPYAECCFVYDLAHFEMAMDSRYEQAIYLDGSFIENEQIYKIT